MDESIQSEENQAFYNYVLSIRPQGGTLLDIGCGVGNFLVKFNRNPAFTTQGVELSQFAALEAKKKGLAVIHGDVRSLEVAAESYDLISMLYLLEHMPDPVGLLKQVERLLRPGGLALIAVPNYHYLRLFRVGPACRLLYRKSTRLEAQEHLVNFTPKTLGLAVRQANLIPWKSFCGSPAAKGNPLMKAFRRGMGIGIKGLFYLGIHIGRIHLLARKPKTS